jgi:hypothetical protein
MDGSDGAGKKGAPKWKLTGVHNHQKPVLKRRVAAHKFKGIGLAAEPFRQFHMNQYNAMRSSGSTPEAFVESAVWCRPGSQAGHGAEVIPSVR